MPVTLSVARGRDIAAVRTGAARIGDFGVPRHVDPPEVLDIIAALYDNLNSDPGWGAWFITCDAVIVGLCSLTEPPHAGRGKIGYSVFPGCQGRGFGTAAVALMLAEARAHGLTDMRAETTPYNGASQMILLKSGFVRTGERFDVEDGDLVVWDVCL